MKKNTFGRIFTLLLCSTLVFSSVDFSVFATESTNTEVFSEVSEDETDDLVVDENVIITTEEDSDNNDITTDDAADSDDIVVIDDDDVVYANASTGITGCSTDFANFQDYDSGYDEWFDGFKQSYTDGGSTKYVYGVRYAANATTSNYRDFQPKKSCTALGNGSLSGEANYNTEENRRNAEVAAKNKTLLKSVCPVADSKLQVIANDVCRACDELRFADFSNCTSLYTIGSKAFAECPKLAYVILPGNVTDIDKNSFDSTTKIVCPKASKTIQNLVNAGYSNIWYYEGSAPGIIYATGGNTPTVTNITQLKYTLTVNKTGTGTVTPGTSTYAANTSVNVSWSAGTGYSVSSVKLDGSSKTSSFSVGPFRSNHIVDVVFTANKYKLIFNDNYPGGDFYIAGYKPETLEVTYDAKLPELPTRNLKGYEFLGWKNTKDNSGSWVEAGDKYTTAKDTNLYAQWKSDGKEYEIPLDANGGECDVTSIKVITGSKCPALPTPTRKGYTFKGWGINEGNIVYSIPSKLTASWEANEYTIEFDTKGGILSEDSPKTLIIAYDAKLPELPTPTKEGYEFVGWNDAENGSGTYYSKGLVFKETNDITLYAQWKINNDPTPSPTPSPTPGPIDPDNPDPTPSPTPGPIDPDNPNSYNVTYNLNGGTLSPKNMAKLLPNYENVSIKLPNPKKAGYTFIGWYIGDIKVKKISRNVSICKGNLTVEAKFAIKDSANKFAMPASGPCSISYELNGGTVKTTLPNTYANLAKVKLPKPTKAGYTFVGWFATSNNNELIKVTNIGYKYGVCEGGKNIKLVAKFTPNQYTIKFNKNGGKGKMNSLITYYDVNTLLPAASFTKGNMLVEEWIHKKSNARYKVNSYVKNLTTKGTVTLKANWIIKNGNTNLSYNSSLVSENAMN